METLSLAATALVAAFGPLTLGYLRRDARSASLCDALEFCRMLLAQIAHLQQHRGLSSAWLMGDSSFRGRLDAKEGEIEALFPVLLKMARQEGARSHPCVSGNEMEVFRFRWQDLQGKLPTLTVEQSIAQHTFLIEQLLKWLNAVGEARLETLVGKQRSEVRNYVGRLPAVTECLGQARAIGTGVAARNGCSAVARVRLLFLIARAEALLSQALEVPASGVARDRARYAVQEMARIVRTRMLLSNGVAVSAQVYFDLATKAVDAVFEWIAETGSQLGAVSASVSAGSVHARKA